MWEPPFKNERCQGYGRWRNGRDDYEDPYYSVDPAYWSEVDAIAYWAKNNNPDQE